MSPTPTARGLPTALCPRCDARQLVWREPASNTPRCLACDLELAETAVSHGDAGEVVDRNDYVFYDVTASADPCGCDTCPAQGHCDHTREANEP